MDLQNLAKPPQKGANIGNLSDVRWGKVLLAALAVNILSIVVGFLVVTVYASYLGFQARGAPTWA